MAFFRLCDDDPFVSELRDVFRANVLRIPEERIVPLTVLVSTRQGVRFVGSIGSLLAGPPLDVAAADVKESDMASLNNRRSRLLESEMGLKVLSGLLSGMAGRDVPEVSAHLKEAKSIRFCFPTVNRRYIEIGRIGQLLADRELNHANLLFGALLDPKATVRLIDSVITSRDFEIDLGDDGNAKLKVDAGRLREILAGAKVEVEATDAKHLSFSSKHDLSFAFTCVNVGLSQDGAIRAIAPSADKVASPQLAAPRDSDHGLEEHVLLTRAPELVQFASNA